MYYDPNWMYDGKPKGKPPDLVNMVNTTPLVLKQDYVSLADVIVQDQTNIPRYNPVREVAPQAHQKNNEMDTQYISADNRSDSERRISQDYTERVNNPSANVQIKEGAQNILRYTENPLRLIGDLLNVIAPNSNISSDLPNTSKDRLDHRLIQESPYLSDAYKLNSTLNIARNMGINSLINVGVAELGWALPYSNSFSVGIKQLFRHGSTSNLAADLLQLSKTNIDKISDGDLAELTNALFNAISTISHLDNFDASGVYNKLKKWGSLSPADKIDTYKDIYNLSLSLNQQLQRE